MLDAGFFAALPRGAGIVNLARGAHVVDADLLAALDCGQLQHAVLDVFHTEPLPAGHAFWSHPQVTVLPHVAAQTDPHSAARWSRPTCGRWPRAGRWPTWCSSSAATERSPPSRQSQRLGWPNGIVISNRPLP